MPSFRVSITEVARRCSVNKSTVSRVLNNTKLGRYTISSALRNRILKVAQELNCRPSAAARSLSDTPTHLIGVLGVGGIWPDHVGPEEESIDAMAKSLDAHGYEICMQFTSIRRGLFDLPPLRVDGIVTVGATNLDDLQKLEESGLPYVSVNGVVGPHGTQVIPDDTQGTRMAVEYLKSLGHKRIAYFDNPTIAASHPGIFARRKSFAASLREFGLESPPSDLPNLPKDVPWDSAYAPFLKDAIVEGGATAVLAYSHFIAISLLRVGHDMGLRVPNDFSLMCFNNVPFLKLTTPALTAIDLPSGAMGQAAAEMLLQAISKGKRISRKTRKLKETLIIRESTAAPALA
jgi:LacI family transcriptional regulator